MLILIPTEIEAGSLRSQLAAAGATVEVCGFGPIVAAARTMQAIAKHRPDKVVLLGIAGALAETLQVGLAYEFSEVVCYGIGAGSGYQYRSSQQLGWQQWPGSAMTAGRTEETRTGGFGTGGFGTGEIGDRLPLQCQSRPAPGPLLTCCAASASADDVAQRLAVYPAAVAEDMEGFAVAAACHLNHIPLRIIRGMSNRAGDRRHAVWQVQQALEAALSLAFQSAP